MAGAEEREARSIALEKAYVHEVYEQISCQFTDGRFRAWPRVKQFVSELEPGSLVCDVGCGNGKYLNINPAAFKIGSDRCKKLTEVAREKEHEVLICDNLALPFRDESFDAVLSIAVVHHFATTERRVHALRELARVLRIGGRLIITVWAMEQRHRKFESQDVLVPWHKPQHFSSDDKTPSVERDLTSTTTSEEDGHPYNAYTQTSDSDSCRSPRTGQRKRGRSRHKGRSIDPSRPSSSQSSSDLSSPNETCYSFVRRALQKLAGGKRSGSGHRPWFLQTLDSSKPWGSCTKEPPHTPELDKQDSLGNIEDLPIELRRLEEDEPTIVTTQRRQTFACQAPVHETVTLNQKSKSLSDILGVLSTGLLRPRKPNGEVTNLVRSRSSFSSLAPLGECEAGTSSVSTAVTSITITTTSTTTTIVMSSTTSSTTTSTGRPGRPVLVKQKKSIHESDGEEESAENRDTLAEMRNIVKSLPEFKVRDSPVRSSRKNIFKQSSLNEELMSTERLREKERVRQNIQKQASLNEELICNKPRSDKLDSIRESLFSANNKRFQMLKNGLTKLKSTSITKSEVKKDTKGQYSFRNGFVRMLQSWKSDVGVLSTSVDSAGKVPSSEADSEEQSDSSSAFNEQGGKGKKSLQPLFNRKERNPAALRAWASQGDSGDSLESSSPKRKNADESEEPREKERRPSKEDGSDSSKDSSLQSDTSVDSEDSFASVIFIPKPEPKGEQEDEPPPKSPLKTNGSRAVIPDPPPAESEKQVTVEKTTPAEEETKPVVNNSPPLEDEPEDTFVKIQELVRKHCSDLQLDVLESPKEVSPIVPIVFPRPEYPFVRRGSARPTQLPARTIPKLLSLELFNPETDDLDSDSSGVSSPDSVSSVISVMNEGPEQSSQSDLPAPEASSSSNRQDNIESSQAEPTAAPEASATQSTQSEGELADANGGKSEGPQEESYPETPTNNQQCLPIKQEPSEASAMATSPSPTDNKDQVAENSTSSSSLQLEDKDNLFLLDEGLDDSSSSAQSKSPSSTLLEAAASVASSLEGAVDAVIQSSPRARRKLLENPLTALGYWSLQSDSKYAANSEGLIRGTKQVLTQACCGVNLEEIDADDYRKSSSSSSSEDCRQHLTEFAEKLSEALLEEIDRYSESCGASNSIRNMNLKSLPQSTVRKYSCEFAHDVHDLKQSASEHSCRAFDASFSNDTGKSYSYPTSLHSAEASLLSAPFRELGREIAEQSRVTSTVRKRSPISDRYHSEGDYSPDHIGKSRSPIREYQEGIIPHRSPTFERKKKLSETHSPIGAGLSRTSLKECDAVKRDSSRTIAQDSGSSSRFASLGNEYTSFNLPRSPVSERNVQSSTSTGISSICGRDRLTETGLFQPYTSSLPLQHDSSRLGHKQSPDTKDNGALYAWKSKSPVKDFSFLDSSQLISPSRSPGRETKISQIGTPTRDTVSAQEDKLLLSRESAFRDNAKPRSPVAESIRKSPLQQRRLMDYSRSPGEEITFEKCMKSPIKEASYRSRSMSKSPTGDTCVDSKSPDRVDGTYLLSSKFLAKNNIPMEFGSTSSVANTGNFLETRKSGFSAEEEAVGIIRRTPSPMSDKTFSDLKIRSPVSEEKHVKISPTKSPSKEDKMKLYSSIQAAKTFMESMEKKSPIRETTYLDSSKSSSPVKDRTLIDFPKSRPLRKGSFWDLATSWSAKDEECFTEPNASRKATKEGFFKGYKNYRSRFGRMLAYGDRTPLDPLRTMSPVREDDIDPVQDRNYERVTMRLAQSGRLLREQSKMKTQQYQSDMGKEDNKCEISKETLDTLQPDSKEKSTKVSDSSVMEDLSQTVYDPINCADSPVSVDSKDNTESHKKIVSKISDDQEKPSTSKTTKVACSVDSNECTLRKSCDQSSTLASVSRGIVISDSSSKVAVAEVKVLPQDKPKAEEEANETSSVNSSDNCPTNLHASCSSVQPKSSVSKGVEESASKYNEEKVGNCQTPCTSIVQKEDKCSGKKCNNGPTSKHTVQNRKEEVNEESIAGKSVKETCTDSKKASVETKKTNSKLVQEAAASNSLNSSVIKGSSARNESSIRMENAAKHENNTESKSSEKPKTCHLPMPNKKVAIRASSLESALPSRRSDMESIHAADRKMPSAEHIEKDSKSVKSTSQLQLPAKKVAIRSSSLESSMPCNHGDQMLKDKKEANGAHVEQLAKEAMLNATNKERKFGSKDSGSRSASCESKTIDEQQPADIESVQKTASCETSLSGSTSQDSLQSDTGGALTFHRYYHVFREGELDQLIERYVDNLHIISSYYDHANWCVIAEKVQVWTI